MKRRVQLRLCVAAAFQSFILLSVPAAGLAPPTPPPRVVLVAAGEDDYRMKRGSYCSDDGCLDTVFPITKRELDVCEGARIKMRIGVRARRVTVEKFKNGRLNKYADATPTPDGSGRVWRFQIPEGGPSGVDVGVWVKYRRATPYRDGGFGARLRVSSC